MTSRHHTIPLRCPELQIEEALAAGTIYPGELIAMDSDGKMAVHASAGGKCERAFAVENANSGQGVEGAYSVADLGLAYPYSWTDRVEYMIAHRGDLVAARLKKGYSYSKGQPLMSGGDGSLIPYCSWGVPAASSSTTTTTTAEPADNAVIAWCQETLDMSAYTANALVMVRID